MCLPGAQNRLSLTKARASGRRVSLAASWLLGLLNDAQQLVALVLVTDYFSSTCRSYIHHMTAPSHAVLLGASRGCGYHALLRLLTPETSWSATILLRKPEIIEHDPYFQPYITSGRLQLVKGDATRYEDVKMLFEREGKKVDVVISSVGESISILPALSPVCSVQHDPYKRDRHRLG